MIALLSNLGNQLVTTVTTHWDVILIKGNINYFIILNDTYHHHLYKSLSLRKVRSYEQARRGK